MPNSEYKPLNSQRHIQEYEKQTLFFTGRHLDSHFVLHHHSSWHWLWLRQDFFKRATLCRVLPLCGFIVIIWKWSLQISSRGRDTFRVISYFYNQTITTFPLLSPPHQCVKLPYLSSTQAATGHYARYYYTWRFLLTKPTGWATAGAPTHLWVCVHACMCVWAGTGWSQWGWGLSGVSIYDMCLV